MRFSQLFPNRSITVLQNRYSHATLRVASAFSTAASQSPSNARAASISFLGLGRMGSEMAYNLFSKRHALAREEERSIDTIDQSFVVCDAVPEAARAFVRNFQSQFPRSKIRIVETPEEAAMASATVITMLPSSPQVRTVYTGTHGVLSALRTLPPEDRAQTLCIDSTTLDVEVARQVASEVINMGAQMVDAPVSGGVAGAKAGTLTFLVGGSEAAFKLASPFLEHMGRRIVHCGGAGSGLAAKICNNLMLGVEQVVTAEAMLLGQRLGVRPEVLADVIGSSTGACWSMSKNNPVPAATPGIAPPSERDFEGGFATALMIKDVGLAKESAERMGVSLPLGAAAERVYEAATKDLPELTRKDFSSVYRYLESLSMRK
ncbi:hypothetical protein ACEPAI_5036 [Sanghuangporus weigelae]